MSDFFEYILARTFGAPSEIRPRPTARFEKPERIDAATEEPSPAESATPMAAALPQKGDNTHLFRGAIAEKPAARPSPPSAHHPEPPLQPASPVRPLEAKPRSGAELTGTAAPFSSQIIESHPQPEAAQPKLPWHAPPSPHARAAAGEGPVIQRQDHPVAEHISKAITPAVAPLLPAEWNRPSGLPEAKHAAPAGTIVHVTIGRVEVRVLAPAPPRPAAPRGAISRPARSLDDYLRRRNGGER